MAFERFTTDARAAVQAAGAEARLRGHPTVEAEHLLLAIAARPEFRGLGLDREAIAEALEREECESLAAVGIPLDDLPHPTAGRVPGKPRFATSAKLALQRALTAAARRGDRRLQAHHVLLGVLAAQRGRVPRALRIAGIDADELRGRL